MSFAYSKALLNAAISYKEYRHTIDDQLLMPANSEKQEKMNEYIRFNNDLMNEYDRTYRVRDDVKNKLETMQPIQLLALTEAWCGDAAFSLPLFAAMERLLPEKIKLYIFFRDQNVELMEANLTDGGRSIPKVIFLDGTCNELGKWGPRPQALQPLVKAWKEINLPIPEFIVRTKNWYEADSTSSTQNEILKVLERAESPR